MRKCMFVVGGIALALIIIGAIIPNVVPVLCGMLGLAVALRFTQAALTHDPSNGIFVFPLVIKSGTIKITVDNRVICISHTSARFQ